jgi:PAS domain S-box-containing protein
MIALTISTMSGALVAALIFFVFWLSDRSSRWNLRWMICHICIGVAILANTLLREQSLESIRLVLYLSVSFAAVSLIAGVLEFIGRRISTAKLLSAGGIAFVLYWAGGQIDLNASGYVAVLVLGAIYTAGSVYLWRKGDVYSRIAAFFLLVRALNAFAFQYLQTHGALEFVLISSNVTILTSATGLLIATYADRARRSRELMAALVEAQKTEVAARRAGENRLRQIEAIATNLLGIVFQRVQKADGSVEFPFLAGKLLDVLPIDLREAARSHALFATLVDRVDRERYVAEVARCDREVTPFDIEFRVRDRGGETRWLHSVSTPHRMPNGDVVWDGVIVETSAAHRELEARLLSESKYRALFDDMPVGLIEASPGGHILIANRAWRRMFGLDDDVDLGTINTADLYVDPKQQRNFLDALRPGGEAVQFNTGFWRDGKEVQGEGYARLLADGAGMPQTIVGVIVDTTERQMLEDQLRQAQKMEAVGQLTGGVAHDFNNLLTVIMGSGELLHEALGDQPQLQQLADTLMHASQRGAELTRSLLAFSRKQALQPEVTDVNELVTRVEGLFRRTLGEHVEIALVRAERVGDVTVDRAQLEAALLNLAVNARDAMPNGGRLTIETANVDLDQDYARQNDDVTPGSYVMIAVSDTGEGMTREVMSRAFDPFFTTKEIGKGSGLGLSMVYGLIKQSHGHIKLYSELGEGTTVRLYLPHTAAADRHVGAAPEEVEFLGRDEMVLVVEDDDMVRSYVERLLARLNYRVLSAANGAAALELLRQDHSVDVLFTDVVMPGMMGPQLAAEARRLIPDLKVLYTSGFTEAGRTREELGNDELLSKPYQRHELAAKLRAVLDRPTSRP